MNLSIPRRFVVALLSAALAVPSLRAWDAEGHKIVNQLALASLPADFPAFVREAAAAERIAFLANVPDRWRNVDPAKNTDHTREWPGFAPWAITEYYHKLRSAFAYLKAYQEVGGTPEEIANSRADVIYIMGVMGHYIGDGAQPLHTTMHFNGWSGANPNGYSTWPGLHSWIDGGFALKARIRAADLLSRVTRAEPLAQPARTDGRDPFFVTAMDYLLAQHALVEPLYQLEKSGKLGHGEQPITDEARALIEGQFLKGGNMLARVWLTAWRTAPVDTYLRTQLGKRQQGVAPSAVKTSVQ